MKPDDSLHSQTLVVTSGAEPAKLPPSFGSGRYEPRRLLGEGGQKQVFLARDTRLDRDVVIAVLKAELDQEGLTRLVREAQAMARLGDHPNIVTVHDMGDEAGRPYIVSQYIEGGSVADLIKSADRHRLSIDQAIQVAPQIATALEHCHSHGIIHRDLKPGNVWLTGDGTVKLGDFGLAISADFSRITTKGTFVGTATYLPPEVALGHEIEPRSDLYSLGIMLYEMVTGRPPFMSDQLIGIISQHINSPPVAPSWRNPEVPKALEALILKLLAKAPEERPDGAAAVTIALESIASSASTLAERVATPDDRSLSRLARGVFVGREQETRELRTALGEAMNGQGRLIMLVGEPGSGKTRMTEELALYARLSGAQVLAGRCYEGEGAPPFWPWVQIIRSYVQEIEPEALLSVMGSGAADIGQVVTAIKDRLPDLPPPPRLEPEQARFRLFDSVTTFLKNAGRLQPVVVILDDLHWADEPSLLLLQFLAREFKDARLLIVGAYRDVDLTRQHPLSRALGELSREGLGRRIILRGLAKEDVARFIEMTTGFEPSATLVDKVYRQTEGNPFFVNEIVKLLVVEGRLEHPDAIASSSFRLPEGVREVIGRRLDRLSDECNRILTFASVIGREFELDALELLSESSGEHVLERLDEAIAARVINEMPRAIGRYSFAHALIREALYDEISTTRRVRVHRRTGEVIEKLYAGSLESHLAELAHHFFEAAYTGCADKAVEYAVRAAERAVTQLAYEEAVNHYEQALQALELLEPADAALNCEVLLGLGDAHKKAGHSEEAREVYVRAAGQARQMKSPAHLARATLGTATSLTGIIGRVDETQVNLLEEALSALPQTDSPLRAMVLAHLALAHYYSPDLREPLSREAVEMARRVADPRAEMAALYSRHAALSATVNVEERLKIATELLALAERIDDKERMLRGHYLRMLDQLEIGDMPAVNKEIEAYDSLSKELRQPLYLWQTPFFRASLALLEGRFQECEQLAQEGLAKAQRTVDPTTGMFFDVVMTALRLVQGREEDREDAIKRFMKRYTKIPGERAVLANLYCRLGRFEEAGREFEQVTADNFGGLPRDGSWVVTMANLCFVCSYLRDTARAATLYGLLLPYANRQVVTGRSAVAAGSVSRFLGILATTMQQWDKAVKHFEDALEMNERLEARPFIALTQKEYGAMLLTRGAERDREKAVHLLDRALATGLELGMLGLIRDVQTLKATL